MIYFKEGIPYKQPGETSFMVTFNYDQRIVDTIRQVPNAIYHKKFKAWEIPTTSLSRAVKSLSNLEPIDITLKTENSSDKDKLTHSIQLNTNYKSKPFPYQEEGIKYGLSHDKWLLLDSPGLGKTLQMIYLAQELKEQGEINHCLVICGVNALKYNWKSEIIKHSDLSVKILGERKTKKGTSRVGGIKERLEDLKAPIEEFFVITNVETLRNKDIVTELTKGKNKFDMIVIDEMHKCLHGDTLIMTNKGELPISYLATREQPFWYKILSYNETTGEQEYKPLTGGYIGEEILYEFEFETEDGQLHTLKMTENHPVYTKNRGYVQAKDLVESDIIEFNEDFVTKDKIENLYTKMSAKDLAKFIPGIKDNSKSRDHYCLKMLKLIGLYQPPSDRGQIHEQYRIKAMQDKYGVDNCMKLPDVVQKCQKVFTPEFIQQFNTNKGGNGRLSKAESQAMDFLVSLGFEYNKAIKLNDEIRKEINNRAFNYKPDFYSDKYKMAIELDGHSHSCPEAKERDAKKEKALALLGIKTVRFDNKFVLNHYEDFKKEVIKICKLN